MCKALLFQPEQGRVVGRQLNFHPAPLDVRHDVLAANTIGQQVFDTRRLHRQLELQLCRRIAVVHDRYDGLTVQHTGVSVALGRQMQLLDLAPAQLRTFGLEFSEFCVYTGNRIGGLCVLEVFQLEAGAERPVAAPLFFALDCKF